jgi:putative hemolysin
MRFVVCSCAALFAACVSAPPPDNPTASARAEQRSEARGLEQAEAECAKQGKHAEASRVDGETIYNCVSRD